MRSILKADEDNKLLSKDVLIYFEKATVLKIHNSLNNKMNKSFKNRNYLEIILLKRVLKTCNLMEEESFKQMIYMMSLRKICICTSSIVLMMYLRISYQF